MSVGKAAPVDRLLRPVHRWVWGDFDRRVRKLLAFAEVETDGGRDILRAAEVTPDPLLRRLYLAHAIDELRHGELFRQRGAALIQEYLRRLNNPASRNARRDATGPAKDTVFNGTPLPGGHGLDDLQVQGEPDHRLLAFLHVAEKAAAGRFAIYRECVDDDPATRAIFEEVLRDEVFHMNYTYTQLARIRPESFRTQVWRARGTRLWNRYVRLAAGVANVMGSTLLTLQYFILLPPFAWLAKRAERREPLGWRPIARDRKESSTSLY
jgi:hypothetical protein